MDCWSFQNTRRQCLQYFGELLLQIASLHWVSENIKSFGGDPSKVRRMNPLIFLKTIILTRIFVLGYNIWRISWRRVCCLSPLEVCCLFRRSLDCIKACSNVQSMSLPCLRTGLQSAHWLQFTRALSVLPARICSTQPLFSLALLCHPCQAWKNTLLIIHPG